MREYAKMCGGTGGVESVRKELFTPGVTHAPGSEGVLPWSRLREQDALAPMRNVNTYVRNRSCDPDARFNAKASFTDPG